jgi:hypothetical protein
MSLAQAQRAIAPSPYRALVEFIIAREAVRIKKDGGARAPWTRDEILQTGYFCNVHREHDRVTRWIAKHWRKPHAADLDLWFAMTVARFVNWPATLDALGYPVPWDSEHFLAVMARRKTRGETVYGGAYMIRADNANPGTPTAEYQAAKVFAPLWRDRERLRPRRGDTLASYFAKLSKYHGMGGGFMAGQVIADVKYVNPLRQSDDWWTFAVSGPGSRKGLNYLLGRDPKNPWRSEREWRQAFDAVWTAIEPELDGIELHAQDLQNCLCEFSKYETIRLGGRPKRWYKRGHGGEVRDV